MNRRTLQKLSVRARNYGLSAVLLGAAACGPPPEVCADDSEGTPVPLAATAPVPHAHNDYEHERPLEDALASRFRSVEADVFYSDGRFEVSHYGFGSKGTLESMYLAPLQAKVDERGSVHGDGETFFLWVDLKDGHDSLVTTLHETLSRFPMLTAGSVKVVLTGDAKMKARYAEVHGASALAERDSNDFSPDDPPADASWRYYSLNFGKYLSWSGNGQLPASESRRMACIVNRAHALDRKVRFFSGPDTEDAWGAAIEHGVDFLHTDKLEAMAKFLETR